MSAFRIQTSSSQPAEFTVRATSAETMKIPEPIIEPATMALASTNPSSRRNVPSYATATVPVRSVMLEDLVSSRKLHHAVIRVPNVHRAKRGGAEQRVRNVFHLQRSEERTELFGPRLKSHMVHTAHATYGPRRPFLGKIEKRQL